jgi:hypothetical protein
MTQVVRVRSFDPGIPPPVTPRVADGLTPVAETVDGLLQTVLATGASEAEAFALVAQAHGVPAVLPVLLAALPAKPQDGYGYYPPRLLFDVAAIDPDLAGAATSQWLLDHRGWTVNVDLGNAAWVTDLPVGIHLDGGFDLRGTGIRALPAGLRVTGGLNVCWCEGWDGRIPADAQIGGTVYTDCHRDGLALDEWRHRYPHGER